MPSSVTSPWSPRGKEIRELIGGRYQLLPHGQFACKWHRRSSAAGQPGRDAERPEAPPPCEQDGSSSPPWVRSGALSDLMLAILPDGRQVAVIPMVDRIGTVMPREWALIKQAARSVRWPLLRHAYQTSLERFQRWKKIGPQTLAAIEAQQRAIIAGHSSNHESFRLQREDWGLSDWIFCYGHDLYYSESDSDEAKEKCVGLIGSFQPCRRALNAVAVTTGYTPEAVSSAIHRTGSRARPYVDARRCFPQHPGKG